MSPPDDARTSEPAPFAPFTVRRSERIYASPWCGLRRDWLVLDDGRLQEHHVFEIGPAVVVVPVLEDGSIVFLWQFRHSTQRSHWEVPAGRIKQGETAAQAAGRELLEETGCIAARIERIAGFHPTAGISPHYAHALVATGCRFDRAPQPEPAERLSVHAFGSREVRARLVRGEFEDGFTALALFYHFSRTGLDD